MQVETPRLPLLGGEEDLLEEGPRGLLAEPRVLEGVPPLFYLRRNPHLADLVDRTRPPKPVRAPYSHDIEAGKNTYVYDAHTYHTKVPPQGIARLIEYYTRPGDTVLDPFCGSGMTGCAAVGLERKAVLCDLSPAAAFIAFNLMTPVRVDRYMGAVTRILEAARGLERTLYATRCRACGRSIPALYLVWSYHMKCTRCGAQFLLWDVARDERGRPRDSKIETQFKCPECATLLRKSQLTRSNRSPVQIGYHCCEAGRKEATADPDESDLALLEAIERAGVPESLWYPRDQLPEGINTRQPIAAGIRTVDDAYTTRALWAMAYLWDVASRWPDAELSRKLLFTLTSLYKRVTVFSEFRFWGGSGNTANFNVPAIMNEQNVFRAFERKARTIAWYFRDVPQIDRQLRVSTQSACGLDQLPDRSIDYVFTDPPFGGNINYSEMNFLWESWMRVHTDNTEEAIINRVQGKSVAEYRELLGEAFSEARRVLKDGGWMTVMFHNSSARVWNALVSAIRESGFSIEGIQTFDKRHGTFKEFVSDNAVGYNMVLHCAKARGGRPPALRAGAGGREDRLVEFLQRALRKPRERYTVTYLHVDRQEELDYRRLYADWLMQAVPGQAVELDFSQFRAVVDQVIIGQEGRADETRGG
jgi:DNA modification methylase/DNA-directed RNA polymerase subunit RPC12/RpoP